MITLSRTEIKAYPPVESLMEAIAAQHQPAPHTKEVLIKNRHIKDFCEVAEHYLEIKKKTSLYLSYTTNTWIERNRLLVRIDSITVYDDAADFHLHRLRGLHSGEAANFPEQN